jgi:hypothetical protein
MRRYRGPGDGLDEPRPERPADNAAHQLLRTWADAVQRQALVRIERKVDAIAKAVGLKLGRGDRS